jgi:transcriptional regulator GlxA family with amidase domain
MRLRMNRAKQLLRTSNLSIKEVAQELGYMRQHEFTRAFSRALGKSPSEWRSEADQS